MAPRKLSEETKLVLSLLAQTNVAPDSTRAAAIIGIQESDL